MKRRLFVVSAALCAVAILSLAGWLILNGSTSSNRTLRRIDGGDLIYKNATKSISALTDATMQVSKGLETVTENDYFSQITNQTLSFTGMGTEDFRATTTETVIYGDHKVEISELFINDVCYMTVEDALFSCPVSADEYRSRLVPPVILNCDLYGSVEGFDTGDDYLIRMTQPMDAEQWALPQGATLLNATGEACVAYDGTLKKSTYNILFQTKDAQMLLTVTAEPTSFSSDITPPPDTSSYIPISDLDAPRLLEQAGGYLTQADNIKSIYTDSIYFQSFGDQRQQKKTVHTRYNRDWTARVDDEITLTNDSKLGQPSVLLQTELFSNGLYSVSTDGAPAESQPDISEPAMRTYCKNLLLSTVMLPSYITGAEIADSGDNLYISFTASYAFAKQVISKACETMYRQPDMLSGLENETSTDALTCYLEINKHTGLPTASGISFSGTYTIESLPYKTHFHAEQTYQFIQQSIAE